jgi:hypothetical protein
MTAPFLGSALNQLSSPRGAASARGGPGGGIGGAEQRRPVERLNFSSIPTVIISGENRSDPGYASFLLAVAGAINPSLRPFQFYRPSAGPPPGFHPPRGSLPAPRPSAAPHSVLIRAWALGSPPWVPLICQSVFRPRVRGAFLFASSFFLPSPGVSWRCDLVREQRGFAGNTQMYYGEYITAGQIFLK